MGLPTIVLVGGFLGAGKTSLILAASKLLLSRGVRVAAIMNDQAAGLVDTRFMEANRVAVREVAGGCFCCRFSDLLDAASQLTLDQPDVIFAEPVGSCIDLSATIIQPLKAFHLSSYRVAPLTVLFDPAGAESVYGANSPQDVEYLFQKQISEADILCSTKADLYPVQPTLPLPVDFSLSSKTFNGIDHWLDEVLSGGRIAGSKLLEVDYACYAAAEAALGWINVHAQVTLTKPANPSMLVGPLLDDLFHRLSCAGIHVAHLKLFDQSNTGFIKASITTPQAAPTVQGDLLADTAPTHELAINLRAIADPAHLAVLLTHVLDTIPGIVHIRHQSSFRPSPPTPEHRFNFIA